MVSSYLGQPHQIPIAQFSDDNTLAALCHCSATIRVYVFVRREAHNVPATSLSGPDKFVKSKKFRFRRLLFSNCKRFSTILVSLFVMIFTTTTIILLIYRNGHQKPTAAVASPSWKCAGRQAVPDDFFRSEPQPKISNGTVLSDLYVLLCPKNLHGQRVGNQLFNLAALLHVARLTGRRVALIRERNWWIDRIFNLNNIPSFDNDVRDRLCPCVTFKESAALAYEHDWSEKLPGRSDLVNQTILLCGFTQSWLYTTGVERQLRRHLQPKRPVAAEVCRYFEGIRPHRWSDDERIRLRWNSHTRRGYQIFREFGTRLHDTPVAVLRKSHRLHRQQ